MELEAAIRFRGARGPYVLFDAVDLHALGVEPLLAEVVPALGLSRSDLDMVAGGEGGKAPVDLVVWLPAPRAARESRGPG